MPRPFLDNHHRKSFSWQDILIHIGMGLMPAIGVLFLDWNIYTVIFLFGWETFVIGIFHFFKMNACGEKHGDQYFFLLHYGIFVFVQSILMIIFFWPGEQWDSQAFLSGAVYSILFVGSDFLKNILQGDGYKKTSASAIMFEPYPRIFTQQFFIIICGIFTLGMPEKNETLMITLFVLFKLIFEIVWLVKKPSMGRMK
jgi:hypothetical protein